MTRVSQLPRLLLLALVAALLLVPVHPADAAATGPAPVLAKEKHCANGKASKVVRDSYGEARKGIDISVVGIWNKDSDACFWTTAVGKFTAKRAQIIQVYYDTKRSKKGWEYQLFAYSNKDGDSHSGAYLAKRTKGGGVLVDCPVYSFFKAGKGQIGIGAPKTCFGGASHIKVKVIVWDVTKYRSRNRWRGYGDAAPNSTYSPLV